MNPLHDADIEQPRLQPQPHQDPQPDLDPEDSRIVRKIGDCEVSMVKDRGTINYNPLNLFLKIDLLITLKLY